MPIESSTIVYNANAFAIGAVAPIHDKNNINNQEKSFLMNNINTNMKADNTAMDTVHPMTNEWRLTNNNNNNNNNHNNNGMNESKDGNIEDDNKRIIDSDEHHQNQSGDDDSGDDEQTMDIADNNTNTNAMLSLPIPIKTNKKTDLQIVLDMDETMSHFLANTGTTMTTVTLSDVPFYPAIGVPAPPPPIPTNTNNNNNKWLSSTSTSSLLNKGTHATFLYSSHSSFLSSESNEVTIVLEDGASAPCEKRPLHGLGGMVLVRPHFRSFLDRLSNDPQYNTTIRIWTAAPQSYADQVLNAIGWSPSIKRIYQQHCAKFLLQRPLFAHRVTSATPTATNNSNITNNKSNANANTTNSTNNNANGTKPPSFEVCDLSVGDTIYLKPISQLFSLDGGHQWSPSNTVLIDNNNYVGLQYGQKQVLAPDFIAVPLSDPGLINYWCQILQHRYPSECAIAMRSLGVNRLEDAIRDGRLHIKRLVDDGWMEGIHGYQKIMKSIESAINQSNNPADLGYFGTMTFGEPIV